MIRILLVDDQAVVRAGLRTILEAHDDLEVVGEAAAGREAIDLTTTLVPDVVLMDIRMPGMDGLEATQRLLSAGTAVKIVVLTTYGQDLYLYEALRAGATGFLLKTDPPERLVDAVRAAVSGDRLFSTDITRRLIETFLTAGPPSDTDADRLGVLTPKEREVLGCIAEGLSNAEIAHRLYVSEGTVKTHVTRVLTKLNLRDRVQAVVYAYEHGLVRPGEAHRNQL